jgi:hypothetical protein
MRGVSLFSQKVFPHIAEDGLNFLIGGTRVDVNMETNLQVRINLHIFVLKQFKLLFHPSAHPPSTPIVLRVEADWSNLPCS